LVEPKETEGSDSENANMAGDKNVYSIFHASGIINHEFVPERQTVGTTFVKEVGYEIDRESS
jgi:hypothetical protein